MIEADGQVDAKKALKALSFPTMDDDGLPSSYTQKVLLAVGKWRVKMQNIVDLLQSLEERPDNLEKLLCSLTICLFPLPPHNRPTEFIQEVVTI